MPAGFPLRPVPSLHRPVWEFGLAMAIAHGGGTLFAVLGGLLGTAPAIAGWRSPATP